MANTLLAKLGLDTGPFAKGLSSAEGKLKGFATLAKGTLGAIGLGLGVSAIKSFIDSLDAIAKRARDIGVTASALQEISHQANLAGVSADKLDVGLKTLARTYGKDVKTAMIELAERTEAGTLSVAEANKYFGENAMEMMRILGEGKDAVAKMFDAKGIDSAAAAAERFNDSLENVKNAAMKVGGMILDGWSRIIDAAGEFFNGEEIGSREVKRANERYMQAAIEEEKRRQAERAKAEAEQMKRLEELDKLEEKLNESRKKGMRTVDQILNLQNELNMLEREREKVEEGSAEDVEIYRKIVDKTIALEAAQKKLKEENAKRDAEAAKKAEANRKAAEDAEKKRAEEEKKRAEEKKKAEDDLQKLYKERAEITKQIAENAKAAQKEMLSLVSQNGEGQTQSKASKAEKYRQKAEDARAKGRWNDYARYSDQADKYESEAVDKRKSDLESAGREARRRGDTKTFNRLQEAYKQEGFAANPTNEQVEKLTNIDDSTKKTAQKLEELVNGLKGDTR